jgi:hypothetical protein
MERVENQMPEELESEPQDISSTSNSVGRGHDHGQRKRFT